MTGLEKVSGCNDIGRKHNEQLTELPPGFPRLRNSSRQFAPQEQTTNTAPDQTSNALNI